ncbi:MAG: SpoIIE family protein phosphatase [Bacteroidia bacterium]|nr:SpoIIE family protein phosphatase [Bacteroidia bacterium]
MKLVHTKYKIFLALLFSLQIFLLLPNAYSINTIQLTDPEKDYEIGKYLEIFSDKSETATIQEILSGKYDGEFVQSSSNAPGFSDHHANYWLRFDLKNKTTTTDEWILELGNTNVMVFNIYMVKNGKIIKLTREGNEVPFYERSNHYEKLTYNIQLDPDEAKAVYIKASSEFPLLFNLTLKSPHFFIGKITQLQFLLGIYYGVALVLFIYSIFNFIGLKNRNYLLYGLYILCVALMLFSIDGKTARYLLYDSPIGVYRFMDFVLTCSGFFGIYYTQSFLNTKKFLPKLNKILQAFRYLLFINMFVGQLLPLDHATFINRLIPLPTVFLVITSGILSVRTGYKPARIFLIAFAFFGVGATITDLAFELVLPANVWTLHAIHIGSGLEAILLMFGLVQQVRLLKKEKAEAQEKMIIQLQENEKLKDKVNRELEQKVQERTKEINEKKEELAQKNKDIVDSINYAQKIQEAILPEKDDLYKEIKQSFILYAPKDIVSGDFYWFNKNRDKSISIAACDCTGHGVPGAFMSMIGNDLLNQIIKEKGVVNPAEVLNSLDDGIRESLKQQKEDAKSKDGMDLALINVNFDSKEVQYAGAHNSLYLIRDSSNENTFNGENIKVYENEEYPGHQLIEIRANRVGIGGGLSADKIEFTNNGISYIEGDTFYLFSDGYSDQFGGPKDKKYTSRRFKDFLLKVQSNSMQEQEQLLETEIKNWRGDVEQVDDILVIGVRV